MNGSRIISATECSMPRIKEKYRVFEHESGLRIYVYPKPMKVTYAVLCVGFGSIDCDFTDANGRDIPLPDGTAHFMEHKMFENSDGTDSFEAFSALGADANAYTTYNRTVYMFSCTERLEECLRELLNFVTHPCFKDESVNRERGIIEQEIRMYDDNPYSRAHELLMEAMYFESPVRKKVSGTVESISQITAQTLSDCHKNFYKTSDMSLVICGSVNEQSVLGVVDELLPPDNPSVGKRVLSRKAYCEPRRVRESRIECNMSVSRPILSIGFKLDPTVAADNTLKRDLAIELICEVLFSRASPLYDTLISRDLVSPSFSASVNLSQECLMIHVGAETDHPDEVIRIVDEYVREKQESGFDSEEMERCRRVGYSELVSSFDSTDDIAELLIEGIMYDRNIFDYVSTVESLDVEYVEWVLRSALSTEHRSVVIINPEKNPDQETERN